MKSLLFLFSFILISSEAHAVGVDRFRKDDGPDSSVFFGAEPIYSQMKIDPAGYTAWGFGIGAGYDWHIWTGFGFRSMIGYQRVSGSNTQNTTLKREDVTSSGVEVSVAALVFQRLALGGGFQYRSISVDQTTNAITQSVSYSGMIPFLRASSDLFSEDAIGLSLNATYYTGTIDPVKVTDLQIGVFVKYAMPVRSH